MSTTGKQTHGVLENGRWLTAEQFNAARFGCESGDVVLFKDCAGVHKRTDHDFGAASYNLSTPIHYLIVKAPKPARTLLTAEQAALALLQGKVLQQGCSGFRIRGSELQFTAALPEGCGWIPLWKGGPKLVATMLNGQSYIAE